MMLYQIVGTGKSIDEINQQLSNYTNITHISIQGRPGLNFQFDGKGMITLGNSGIFQIESPYTIKKVQLLSDDLGQLPLIINLIGGVVS